MSLYIPNSGEKEMLKAILESRAIRLGLYKNLVIPDGNTIFDTLEQLPQGGERGYATKDLANVVVENALAANKWFLTINSAGKAEAQYSNAALEWVFAAADVADGNTVYGVFGWCLVMPFDAGAGEIKVGDTITGASSGATAVVTAVMVQSGSWGAAAVGYLCLKSQTGTFQNDENLQVSAVTKAVSNTGATGDSHKRLLFVDALSEGKKIETVGQKITCVPKMNITTV